MNINGNTKPCGICRYGEILGINSQDSPVYARKNRTGTCPKIKETNQEAPAAEELQRKEPTGSSDYRTHYISRFMERR